MYERPQLEIDFGVRYTGDRVGNVTLPSWAASARDCVQQLRTALESPAVSRQLHSWINLVRYLLSPSQCCLMNLLKTGIWLPELRRGG